MDELRVNVVESIDVSLEELVESGKMVSIDGFEEGTAPQPPRTEESEVASMEHIITDKQSHSDSNSQNTPPYEK